MTALDVLYNIANDNNLVNYDFKYCLVNNDKLPFTINNTIARPNHAEDFVSIDKLIPNIDTLSSYRCLGVSIQASNICAIDLDDCVTNSFDKSTINDKALEIIELFKNVAYIEFSFSGHGIRIFFKADDIPNYENLYYTKNSKLHIEYYRPEGSARYVTITGQTIYSNEIKLLDDNNYWRLFKFLNFNMKREKALDIIPDRDDVIDDRHIDILLNLVKTKYLTDYIFQELWFGKAPGSGKNESELDYHLIAYIYENITQDREKVKTVVESSPYFKSKDKKHIVKWTSSSFRYFNYVFDNVRRK